jgi:hypothetical protein
MSIAADSENPVLEHELTHVLEESRMVLPGVQALFGFQLIAVFNDVFNTTLDQPHRLVHLAAIGFAAISVILILTPAAYHRQCEPHSISQRLVDGASFFLTGGMFSLMAAVCLDMYVIAWLVLHSESAALALAGFLFLAFFSLWFLFPRLSKRKHQHD